ncbi:MULTISPECIES: right-handed parallel beta-helix repeat-containing protein [unclassified Carboxylicivirga]|uniref:right-handed parallel beta-helix repeat-containing protein n=1 Tax=Carboxylicivirga TaxID=1628153 RepID=UPI003D3497C3
MKNVLLVALLLLCWKSNAQDIGGDYYVAVNGNDANPGTYEQPFATWQRAVDVALPGDTVYIRGGVYLPKRHAHGTGAFMIIRPRNGIGKSGTKANPICYFAYPGETPILDGSQYIPDGNWNMAIGVEYAEYIHFRGLTVRNIYQYYHPAQAHGISTLAVANMTFENCVVHHVSGRGFYYESGAWTEKYGPGAPFTSDTTRYINCDAYSLCDSIDHTQSNTPGNAADGYKLINYDGNLLVFDGCRAWDYSDDGFDPNPFGRMDMTNCWAFNAKDRIFYQGAWHTMEGNGFKIGGRAAAYAPYDAYSNATVSNCIAANVPGRGFYNNLESEIYNNAIFLNNTSYLNGYGFANVYFGEPAPNGSIFRNNIVYGSTNVSAIQEPYECALGQPPYEESNNTWIYDSGYPYFQYNPAVTVSDNDFVSLDVNQLAQARKADGSLPDITFMQLAPGSDLIDAGTDVGLTYYGNSPDIGAIEYNDGITNTHPSVQLTSPQSGSSFSVGQTIKLSAEASDTDGTVEKVSYYFGDSQKIGESTAAPWSYDWTNTPEGEYQIWAIATDNQNAQTNSKKVNITIEEDNQVIYFKILNTSPNPTVDIITAEFTCPRATKVGINVVDIFNRNALSDHIETDIGRNKLVLNLSTLKTGNYTIILNMEDEEIRVPITRQEIL